MVEQGTNHSDSASLSVISKTTPAVPLEYYRTLSAPITAQWELTDWCNQRCFHCYNYWREDTDQKCIHSLEAQETIKVVSEEIVSAGIFSVTLTGGEPLPFIKKYSSYLQRLHETGIDVKLNTNLTLFDDDKGKLLKDLGIESILTSLISANPEVQDKLANFPGSHQLISKNVRRALEMGFAVSVNMVVSKLNLADVDATAKYVKELGVRHFYTTKVSTPVFNKDFQRYTLSASELRSMFLALKGVKDNYGLSVDSITAYPKCFFNGSDQLDDFSFRVCGAGKSFCTIGFDGGLRPCSHSEQVMGKVQKGGDLKSLWQGLKVWRTEAYIPNECSACTARRTCYGGCRVEAYAMYGSYKAKNPFCDLNNPISPASSRKDNYVGDKFRHNQGEIEFSKRIKYRDELFGGILYLSPKQWIAVNQGLAEFYKQYKGRGFSIQMLSDFLSVDTNRLNQTVGFLLQKNIIKEGG